jgi:hypothetical protein
MVKFFKSTHHNDIQHNDTHQNGTLYRLLFCTVLFMLSVVYTDRRK